MTSDVPNKPSSARRRRLMERFPGAEIRHPSLVDKDQKHLTSDRRAHLGSRTFFLGEVFWTAVTDSGDRMLPALVTRRQPAAWAPVEVAPCSRIRPENAADPAVFVPLGRREKLSEDTVFLLFYRRPAPREVFGAHLDTLDGQDKQRLATQLAALNRALD